MLPAPNVNALCMAECREKTMASLYKRRNTYWIAYYAHGRLIRESLKTSNKQLALREKQAREAELLDPHRRAPIARNLRVDDFWKAYLEQHALPRKRSASIQRTEIVWRQLLEFTGAKRVSDITPDSIRNFMVWRKSKGNSDSTLNNARRELNALFNRGIKLGLISGPNPVAPIDALRLPRRMPEYHKGCDLAKLLSTVGSDETLRRIVLLGAYAGLRKNEIVNARWEWFDFDDPHSPKIHVKSFDGFAIKDYEDRSLPMHSKIVEEFRRGCPGEGFVFTSPRKGEGKAQYRYDPKKRLQKALRKAGLTTEQPFQMLRHTFGSLLAQNGVSIYKIAKWMGHSSVQVTERHYSGLQAYDDEIESL